MLKQIHHKKNEKQEVESFKDKECTEAFDFTNAEKLYIQLVNGELTPLVYAIDKALCGTTIYCSYVNNEILIPLKIGAGKKHITIITLNDIIPNLSKYIPEDNAVLFLSEEEYKQQRNAVSNFKIKTLNQDFRNVLFFYDGVMQETNTGHINLHYTSTKKLTIFLHHGTQSEFKKANEVGKYLWENFGIKPNLFVLHCFVEKKHLIKAVRPSKIDRMYKNEIYGYAMQKLCNNINKIITTNSTGILPVQDNERLQVIDCKEIFEEDLKNQ